MSRSLKLFLVFVLLCLITIICAACKPTEKISPVPQLSRELVVPPTGVPFAIKPTDTSIPPAATIEPVDTLELSTAAPERTETPTPEPTPKPFPVGPIPIDFLTEYGVEKFGSYYPAANYPAPMVILMHWARGDENDWSEIAAWLQNRGVSSAAGSGSADWLDSSWFPPMPEDRSYAVLTFTFSGCNGGCSGFSPEEWLAEAEAAFKAVMKLDGVDPNRLVAIGASIGADGAVDGCMRHNQNYPGQCQGALSLSPGSYLTLDYASAIDSLMAEDPPKPVWCLYAAGDEESAAACQSASGDGYQAFEYEESLHGMMLIGPDVRPQPGALEQILDFLELTLGQ